MIINMRVIVGEITSITTYTCSTSATVKVDLYGYSGIGFGV